VLVGRVTEDDDRQLYPAYLPIHCERTPITAHMIAVDHLI